MYGYYSIQVFPFGYLRVSACLQLVVAFRSLPRPSSALSAKASTVCPYSLDLFVSVSSDTADLYILYCECIIYSAFSSFPYMSLVQKLSFSICSVRNCFSYFLSTEKLFHYTLCSFQRTFFSSPFRVGGDKRNRTVDPLLARQVLSQLSYTPI